MDPAVLKVMFGSMGFGLAGSAVGFLVAIPFAKDFPLAAVALSIAGTLVGTYIGTALMMKK